MVRFPRKGRFSLVQVAAAFAFALNVISSQASDVDSASGSVGAELSEGCEVSDGDKAFGIQVVTDGSCASGGLGCYNDHCRYCKLLDTLKSSHLESCESFGASFPSMAPLAVSSGACHVSSGDAAVGVGGVTDPSCLYGGIGCFSDHCRFCQITSTPQSSQFLLCSWIEGSSSASGSLDAIVGYVGSNLHNGGTEAPGYSSFTSGSEQKEAGTASVCTLTASDGDVSVGINIATDGTCASGGVGCIDNICRFCRAKNTTQAAYLAACPTATQLCTTSVSAGDAAVGVNIVTDASCAGGGVGCIDSVCRFCRTTSTPQSAAYTDCASIGGSSLTTPAPTTNTPAPTTTAPPTSAPVVAVSTPSAKQTCGQAASDGDAAVGIKIVTDTSCSSGGLGCIDQVCRFCRVTTTAQSASFVDCATIQSTSPTPAPTTAAPTTATQANTPTTNTPAIVFVCSRKVSNGDAGVGLDIASDIRCSEGGAGCLDDVCRFCKRFDTPQSQTYLDCSSIPSSDVGSDITFVPIPVVDDSDPTTSTRLLAADASSADSSYDGINATASSLESLEAAASVCAMTVSSGDAAVGINIVTDTSCSSGGTGCIDNVCRYCKTKDTAQSSHLVNCQTSTPAPTTATPTTATPTTATKVCKTTVSDGDAAVGINIITDTNCANGGLGCIDSVCRYCKTKSTDQSAHFGSCSDYRSATTTAPSTTAVPTATPVISTSTYAIQLDCFRTASSGDKSSGLDIVTDIRCGDGGVGCVDSICRFCKRFDTAQSSSYMSCVDIPSSDNGADITFKAIAIDDTPREATDSEPLVTLRESDAFASVGMDDVCANMTLADGQAAGGIGVVLDTVNCPEGLASGCVGTDGCRYCMRFPTNVSDYLDYCEIANSTGVAYDLSGPSSPSEDGNTQLDGVSSEGTSSVGADRVTSAEVSSTNSSTPILGEGGSTLLIAVGTICAGIAVVGFAAFGIKRTVDNLKRNNAQSSDKEKVSPGIENRASVLVNSNVGEPGIISDV